MKKGIIAFLLLALVPLVSAQYGGGFWFGTEQVVDSIVNTLEPFFRVLLGGYDWTGYLLFEKTLLFILISIIVGVILGNLPFFQGKHKGILRLVAIIIGLLGVRNLNYIWVGTILVQYEVLFISIAGILPFMIYWYFIKGFDGWIRKAAWIFYAVIYFGLWATTTIEAYTGVYLWGALAALIYAFFLDSLVIRWLAVADAKKGQTAKRDELVASLRADVEKTIRLEAEGHLSKSSAEHIIKTKREVIKSLMKHPGASGSHSFTI